MKRPAVSFVKPRPFRHEGAPPGARLKQLVERDRQIANAPAGCVMDRVRQRTRHAGYADLADAANAEGIEREVRDDRRRSRRSSGCRH
jgi:hypothetical protein